MPDYTYRVVVRNKKSGRRHMITVRAPNKAAARKAAEHKATDVVEGPYGQVPGRG